MKEMETLLEQYSKTIKRGTQTINLANSLLKLESSLLYHDSPYSSYALGALKSEIAKCYDKLGDSVLSSKMFLDSGRVYVKGAKFFFEYSRDVKELWEPLLDLGINSYSNVIKILEASKKPSLAVQVCRETAEIYEHFEYYTYAGSYYQKCIDFCIKNDLPSPVIFQVIFKAVRAYVKDRKIEEASNFIDHVQQLYTGTNVSNIKKSALLTKRLQELRIYKAILNVMDFKNPNECMQFSRANLEKEYTSYFEAVADATLKNELPSLHVLVHVPVVGIELNEGHLELLHTHYLFVKEAIESKLPRSDVQDQ